MKNWVILFLLLLAAGVALGLARDLFSREIAVHKGIVVAADPGGQDFKWPGQRAPRYKVRLASGEIVDVATTDAQRVPAGGDIDVVELAMPWGQIWYKDRY